MEATRDSSSAMDMAQFEGAFFEEAAEHLAEMERLLVHIDLAAPTAGELDAIFRAAHSIKGGSGMFGFNDMTALTHELESLLDKVRRHELALRPAMVDVLLESSDLLRAQLAFYRGQEKSAPSIASMCERIQGCMTGTPAPATTSASAQPTPSAQRTLDITFPVTAELLPMLPGLYGQLRELGTLTEVVAAAIPAKRGKRKTPVVNDCVVQLVTDTPSDVLLTLFEFIMDSSKVRMVELDPPESPPAQATVEMPATAEPAPAADAGYGFFQPMTPPPAAETSVDASAKAPAEAKRRDNERMADTSIRVSVEKVDQLINQVGELVITQAMLAQSVVNIDPVLHEKLVAGMADLERNTRDLQESVMSIRMLPIAFVFNRFPRLVRDLAAKLGKQVELVMQGEGTELDKGLIEKISDPLTHLVRNSIDHGVETREARKAAGKSEHGTITLRAAHQGGNIVIEVADDGAGLRRDRILAKARERGMSVSDTMSDADVWNLIFAPGFSTAAVVTDVSGRGVGMDVVRRNIHELGGTVEIESVANIGTRMTVRLPLTLAIMDGMSVAVGSEVYILPLASIVESLQVAEGQVRSIAGQGLVIDVRSEYLPVVSLHELFVNGPALGSRASGTMVIVESEGGKAALLVDELLGQHQVVVKSLDANFHKVHGISGATIMGDGRVALILDIPTLTREHRQRGAPHPTSRSSSLARLS